MYVFIEEIYFFMLISLLAVLLDILFKYKNLDEFACSTNLAALPIIELFIKKKKKCIYRNCK